MTALASAAAQAGIENRRILIVDDSPAIHADFQKILARIEPAANRSLNRFEKAIFEESADAGTELGCTPYEIAVALQGEQAVSMVEQAQREGRPFAVVFMDVRMPPGIDGVEAMRRIWDKAPLTEAVLCTAYMDYSHEEIQKHLGITDRLLFLKKPFDPTAVSQMALMMTAKWNLEQQIRQQIQGLESTIMESGKLVTLGQVAGGIAHEINTPLSTVMVLSQILQERAQAGQISFEEVATLAGKVRNAAKRMAGIVRGVRTVAGDPNREESRPVPLNEILIETLGFCRERYLNQGIPIHTEGVPQGLRVFARPVGLSQVILNLLNNAYDALQERPQQEEKWVRIEAEAQEGVVVVRVIDSGPGIPRELAEKIFKPFVSTKAAGKGMGLGLSVSRQIMQNQGGSLEIDAQAANTCFVIRVPAAVD